MISIIENYIKCDECGVHLSYEENDAYVSWNYNRKFRCLYLDCPKCGNSIPIKRIEPE